MSAAAATEPTVSPPLVSDGVFIAWHPYSRRAQLFSEKFGLKLRLVHTLKRRYYLAPARYVLQAARTWRLLRRERPRLIFVQNPPIFAALVVYVYARLAGAHYLMDAHSGALLAPWWRWSLPLHGFLSRRAITTIVTNEHLRELVTGWGAEAFIVADIPTEFQAGSPPKLADGFRIAVINTFSPDEPLVEVMQAAAALPQVHFYITGDPIRAKRAILAGCPGNARFTGFLPDPAYFGLLRSVDGILVLTTNDHTMQRGACEAVSLGVPVITSDWPILRAYFPKGTIHVDNTSAGIRAGVLRLQQERAQLREEMALLRAERQEEWRQKHLALNALIAEALGSHARQASRGARQ